ncbi:MAG: 5'-nucleotidase [Pseudomonadota bacterium]
MPVDITHKLVIAISSRALFDMRSSHAVFETEGLSAYQAYQIKHESDVLEPGEAFQFVKKLLAINTLGLKTGVEVVLLSRNSADTGLRVFNSIEHYGLNISRAAFCGGSDPHRYVPAFGCHLFLSSHAKDVRQALASGVAAATFVSSEQQGQQEDESQVRIAFDGDAVIFSDESERIYQEQGLDAFSKNEKSEALKPLNDGPFVPFLVALNRLQTALPEEHSLIKTALITARSAPAHERVIRTLRHWGIRIDESVFLGGMSKGAFLKAFNADIFFDDQQGHIASAHDHDVAAAHVPNGVTNQ